MTPSCPQTLPEDLSTSRAGTSQLSLSALSLKARSPTPRPSICNYRERSPGQVLKHRKVLQPQRAAPRARLGAVRPGGLPRTLVFSPGLGGPLRPFSPRKKTALVWFWELKITLMSFFYHLQVARAWSSRLESLLGGLWWSAHTGSAPGSPGSLSM